jgi:predicted RNA binding protein YcfA (HicA-like mRNA interferase family)
MDDFRICLNCDYQKGFHVSFRKTGKSRVKIILICPHCGQSYDLGWITSMIKSFKAEKGLIY